MHRTLLALGALGLMASVARPSGPLSHRAASADSVDLVVATGGDGLGLGRAALDIESLDIVDLDALVRYLRSIPQPASPPDTMRFMAVHS